MYLCELGLGLWSHIWIKRIWVDVVSTERPRTVRRRLPVLLPPHRLRAAPCRVLPLPVGGASRQPRGQLVPLWRGRADVRTRSGLNPIPPQDLDLVAVFVRRDAVAAGGDRAAMEGDLMASRGRRDVDRGRRGPGLRRGPGSRLPRLMSRGRRSLLQVDLRRVGSSFWTTNDPQVLRMSAVVDPPTVGATLGDGPLGPAAPHVVQPDQTYRQRRQRSPSQKSPRIHEMIRMKSNPPCPSPNLALCAQVRPRWKPSSRHTTLARFKSISSSHTVPQAPSWNTSTRPSLALRRFTPAKRTSWAEVGGGWRSRRQRSVCRNPKHNILVE